MGFNETTLRAPARGRAGLIPPLRDGVDACGLIRAARSGESAALGRLLSGHRRYLRALADAALCGTLRSKADASDVVQETLLRACQCFRRFRGTTRKELTAWLRRILIRNLADLGRHYRAMGARDVQRERSLPSDGLDRLAQAREECPSLQAMRVESIALLERLLARMSPNHRQVLVLRHLEQLPWKEVGRRMGRTPEAARMLWVRAVAQLAPLVRDRGL